MIAVRVGGLDDQRVPVVSQDNAVDRCRFANCAHVPGGAGKGCKSGGGAIITRHPNGDLGKAAARLPVCHRML